MKKLLITAALFAALTSCENQDFYEIPSMPGTSIPIENPTSLTVTTHAESTVTENINVTLLSPDGGQVMASFGTNAAVDVEAGQYIILKTNDPWEGVEYDAPIVTLPTTDSRVAGPFVSSADDIHAGFKLVTLSPNTHHTHEIALESCTRTIRFAVKLVGTTAEEITSVTYALTGVCTTINLAKPYGPDAASGKATLSGEFPALKADADGNLTATAEARLIGLDITEPQLTITVTLADGTAQDVVMNATSYLRGFYNLKADESYTLGATLTFTKPVPDPEPNPNPDPTPDPEPNPDPTPNPNPDPNPNPNPEPGTGTDPNPNPNPEPGTGTDPNPDPNPDPKPDSEKKPVIITGTIDSWITGWNEDVTGK